MVEYRVTDSHRNRVVKAANAFHAFKSVYSIWPFDVVTAEDVGYYRAEADTHRLLPSRREMSLHRISILFSPEGREWPIATYVMVDRSTTS